MLETQFRSLDLVDPLEKGMVTYSSILAWKIPWTEEPGVGSQRNRQTQWSTLPFLWKAFCIQEVVPYCQEWLLFVPEET